jgi:hypothetical protein
LDATQFKFDRNNAPMKWRPPAELLQPLTIENAHKPSHGKFGYLVSDLSRRHETCQFTLKAT